MDEVNNMMTTGASQPGNSTFSAYKKLPASFSEAELAKPECLPGDPDYRK
jgi:hypothetical protein